jgi:hypothetical protein
VYFRTLSSENIRSWSSAPPDKSEIIEAAKTTLNLADGRSWEPFELRFFFDQELACVFCRKPAVKIGWGFELTLDWSHHFNWEGLETDEEEEVSDGSHCAPRDNEQLPLFINAVSTPTCHASACQIKTLQKMQKWEKSMQPKIKKTGSWTCSLCVYLCDEGPAQPPQPQRFHASAHGDRIP